MSLAHEMGLTPEQLEPNRSYLRTSTELADEWGSRLGNRARGAQLRVGLAWGGNPAHRRDSDRSIPVEAFAALSRIEGVSLYRLQVGRPDLGEPEYPIDDPTGHLSDFADTAALVNQLDLVISVDSAVAHLAGALGKPVWVLCPLRADWRWEIDGRQSPWYATARIFRPLRTADWSPVIDQVRSALVEAIAKNAFSAE